MLAKKMSLFLTSYLQTRPLLVIKNQLAEAMASYTQSFKVCSVLVYPSPPPFFPHKEYKYIFEREFSEVV